MFGNPYLTIINTSRHLSLPPNPIPFDVSSSQAPSTVTIQGSESGESTLIEMVDGPLNGLAFIFGYKPKTHEHSNTLDVFIDDPYASHVHFRISLSRDHGVWIVRNVSQKSPITLNGTKVKKYGMLLYDTMNDIKIAERVHFQIEPAWKVKKTDWEVLRGLDSLQMSELDIQTIAQSKTLTATQHFASTIQDPGSSLSPYHLLDRKITPKLWYIQNIQAMRLLCAIRVPSVDQAYRIYSWYSGLKSKVCLHAKGVYDKDDLAYLVLDHTSYIETFDEIVEPTSGADAFDFLVVFMDFLEYLYAHKVAVGQLIDMTDILVGPTANDFMLFNLTMATEQLSIDALERDHCIDVQSAIELLGKLRPLERPFEDPYADDRFADLRNLVVSTCFTADDFRDHFQHILMRNLHKSSFKQVVLSRMFTIECNMGYYLTAELVPLLCSYFSHNLPRAKKAQETILRANGTDGRRQSGIIHRKDAAELFNRFGVGDLDDTSFNPDRPNKQHEYELMFTVTTYVPLNLWNISQLQFMEIPRDRSKFSPVKVVAKAFGEPHIDGLYVEGPAFLKRCHAMGLDSPEPRVPTTVHSRDEGFDYIVTDPKLLCKAALYNPVSKSIRYVNEVYDETKTDQICREYDLVDLPKGIERAVECHSKGTLEQFEVCSTTEPLSTWPELDARTRKEAAERENPVPEDPPKDYTAEWTENQKALKRKASSNDIIKTKFKSSSSKI